MKTGAASSVFALAGYAVTSLKRRYYEARLAAYEAALRAMKRTFRRC